MGCFIVGAIAAAEQSSHLLVVWKPSWWFTRLNPAYFGADSGRNAKPSSSQASPFLYSSVGACDNQCPELLAVRHGKKV